MPTARSASAADFGHSHPSVGADDASNPWASVGRHPATLGTERRPPGWPPVCGLHNMDMQDLDLEIGFPFVQPLKGEGEVLAGEIPAGKAAECLHVGPYDQLGAAYEALQKWMMTNGYTPSGVAYEFYLNDPQSTPAAELQTKVMFPLT